MITQLRYSVPLPAHSPLFALSVPAQILVASVFIGVALWLVFNNHR